MSDDLFIYVNEQELRKTGLPFLNSKHSDELSQQRSLFRVLANHDIHYRGAR